jgi:hypothetical protein
VRRRERRGEEEPSSRKYLCLSRYFFQKWAANGLDTFPLEEVLKSERGKMARKKQLLPQGHFPAICLYRLEKARSFV